MRRKRRNLHDKTPATSLPSVAAKNRPKSRRRAAAPSRAGERLDPQVRAEMERLLQTGLDDVRVHHDAEAQDAAADLEARAFTRGRDIYFAGGEYDPGTAEGRELLAHELAHTVQNASGASARAPHSTAGLEAEARFAAARYREGRSLQVSGSATASDVLREEEKPEEAVPTLTLHDREITPAHVSGTIAVGALTLKFRYEMGGEGAAAKLLLELPEGMQANIVPLGGGGDLKIVGGSGDAARTIEITAPTGTGDVPRIRATFTAASASHVVIFQFPA